MQRRATRFRADIVERKTTAARICQPADVAELVDAHGSGPCGGDPVEVQVLSSASSQVRSVASSGVPNQCPIVPTCRCLMTAAAWLAWWAERPPEQRTEQQLEAAEAAVTRHCGRPHQDVRRTGRGSWLGWIWGSRRWRRDRQHVRFAFDLHSNRRSRRQTVRGQPRRVESGGQGGQGGNGSVGDLLVSGDPGLNGLCITTTDVQSGHGGGSHWGGGGRGRINQGGGSAGGGHGSGGSGAAIVSGGANQTGGSGKNGLIRVWEFQSTRKQETSDRR